MGIDAIQSYNCQIPQVRFRGETDNYAVTQPQYNDNTEYATQKREGMSKGAKWAIGLGLTGLAAYGIYVLTKGKVKPTEFKPATTIEEAKTFAQEKLGVAIPKDTPLDFMNYANEGLCNLKNKDPKNFGINYLEYKPMDEGIANSTFLADKNWGGITYNSKFVDNIDSVTSEMLNTVSGSNKMLKTVDGKIEYNSDFPQIDISDNLVELANKFKTNPAEMTFKEKLTLHSGLNDANNTLMDLFKKNEGDLSKITDTISVKTDPFEALYSANANIALRKNLGKEGFEALSSESAIKEFKEKHGEIASKVDDFIESPLDFVNSVYTKRLKGEQFEDDVMEVYKKYNGLES